MRKRVIKKREEIQKLPIQKGELVKEVEELCGQNLYGCYSCGTCAAGCPFVEDMDLPPDEVIRWVVLDRVDVLNAESIWICASCYTCAERCPRDLNITKIMEALRQIVLRRKIDHTKVTEISKKEKESIPQLALVSLFRKNIG